MSHAKRRCEEKTYLLDKHVKTEEILTQQAKDLLTVAEHASSDTYSLHVIIIICLMIIPVIILLI